jgi:hypothetical protein
VLCCSGGQHQRQLQFRRCNLEMTTKFSVGILRPVDEEHGIRCRADLSAQAFECDACPESSVALQSTCTSRIVWLPNSALLDRRSAPDQAPLLLTMCRTTISALWLWMHGMLG